MKELIKILILQVQHLLILIQENYNLAILDASLIINQIEQNNKYFSTYTNKQNYRLTIENVSTYVNGTNTSRPSINYIARKNTWNILEDNKIYNKEENTYAYIAKIYNSKYNKIYKSDKLNSYNINNKEYIFNDLYNTEYFTTYHNIKCLSNFDNMQYLQKLKYLTIDCMYIQKFIPKFLPNSIIKLKIINIDLEILCDLDHLTNLELLYLEFRVNHKILINASIQIKELLKINSNLKVIIENYNELKHKDLELVSLATFI